MGSHFTQGRYAGQYAGTIGDFGAYSFNGNKIITTGGGGAVTGKNEDAVKHMKYLSTQAKDDTHFYIHNEVGFNYRMTNLQAALGVAQMEELQEFVERKHRNYNLYKELLQDMPFGKLLDFRSGTDSNQWFYSVELQMNKLNRTLREVIMALQEKGIQTRAIWGLIHEQLPYQDSIAYKIERAVYYSSCILNVPCSTQLTEEEIQYVAEKIRKL